MTASLQGRIAIVTGGGSGLGLATAKAFAREGATVVINDWRLEAAEQAAYALGPGHTAIGGDVADEAAVKTMVDEVLRLHGHVDIVVNNAGMNDNFVPTVDQSLEWWQRMMDVHVTGTYLMAKTAARSMIERRSGVILNVSSMAGIVGLPVRTAYSTAKAGIIMMTKVLGAEWAPHNVRVNAVAPGYMMTPLLARMIEEGKVDDKRIRRRTPMGRFGEAEDIAEAMVFLASDKAKYITGITLPVDGGYGSFGAPSDAFEIE